MHLEDLAHSSVVLEAALHTQEGGGDHLAVHGVALVEIALAYTERLGDALRDRGEDVFEHETRRDRRPYLADQGKTALFSLVCRHASPAGPSSDRLPYPSARAGAG